METCAGSAESTCYRATVDLAFQAYSGGLVLLDGREGVKRVPSPSRGLMLYPPYENLLLVKDQGNALILKYTQIITARSTLCLFK